MSTPRIEPGRLRELGLPGWLLCKVLARASGVPEAHLFTTLGQHKRLFWTWLPFSGMLLGPGRLPRADAELVILRVAHTRGCEYELQHHRRMARRRGIDADKQERIFGGPQAEGLNDRERALLTAVDELVETRNVSAATWQWLARHLDRRQLIEFVTLAGQYDALAATLNTLKVPLDYPE